MLSKNSLIRALVVGVLLTLRFSTSDAQHLVASTEIEKNVAGIHYGASILLEGRKNFALGGFYQFGVQRLSTEIVKVRPYYGVQLQLPVAKCERIAIFLSARAGFVNKDFLLVVPAVITTVRLSPRVGFSIGSGLRMQQASLVARLNLTI